MARDVALDRGPAAFRCDPDRGIAPDVWVGAAAHQSYRHAHAYLRSYRKESKFWEIQEEVKWEGKDEREMLQAMATTQRNNFINKNTTSSVWNQESVERGKFCRDLLNVETFLLHGKSSFSGLDFAGN